MYFKKFYKPIFLLFIFILFILSAFANAKTKTTDRRYNFTIHNFDSHFLNEFTLQDWLYNSQYLKLHFTDADINAEVKKFPKLVYTISAIEIAAKFKSQQKNEISQASELKNYISNDTPSHLFSYFKPDRNGLKPLLYYSNDDRIYVGAAYKYKNKTSRKTAFGYSQYLDLKYSFAQDAFSSTYKNRYQKVLGKWDLFTFANYDHMRWTNFFGLGNETLNNSNDADYNRFRTREFLGKLGLERIINNRQRITINGTFNTLKFIEDKARFLSKAPVYTTPFTYNGTQKFAGAEFQYLYQNINDSSLPTKGFNVLGRVGYNQNLDLKSNHVEKYDIESNIYVPLSKKFSYALRTGGSTLTGNPQFFQYNNTGTADDFRGFERTRFYGNSNAFAQNDLRFIAPIHSHLLKGRIGLFTHYDVARVWLNDENSDKWHSGYGGGIIISPSKFATVSASYSISKNESSIGLKILKGL